MSQATPTIPTIPTTASPLTIVLVHGAFADASSWTGMIERLQARGVQVMAPANPLRGISIDSAYLAGVFDQIPGPVLAVGHSYGGAVITNAATKSKNVVCLVYVAAFAPERGETLGSTRPRTADRRRSSTSTRRKHATPSLATSPIGRPR
jgi:pimeloyl-ACP methyl ester carboxylesterase